MWDNILMKKNIVGQEISSKFISKKEYENKLGVVAIGGAIIIMGLMVIFV